MYTKPKVDVLKYRNEYFLQFYSHFNLRKTTDHNVTQIEPYRSLGRLFSVFLVMGFGSFVYFPVENIRVIKFFRFSYGLDFQSVHYLA